MVLGHEGCGVIRTAQQTLSAIDGEVEELRTWLCTIRRGLAYDQGILEKIIDSRARDREAVIKNVRHQVRRIALKPAIAEKVATGMTAVVELGMAGIGVTATAADTVTGGKTAEKMAAAAVAMAAVMTAAVDVAELVVANNWTAAAVPARTGRGMHLFAAGILIFYSPQVREARYP